MRRFGAFGLVPGSDRGRWRWTACRSIGKNCNPWRCPASSISARDWPSAVETGATAAARVERLPGTHTKNLFLESKTGGLFLVVAREDLRLDLNALARALGVTRFSFGRPELLIEALGIAPGAVSPFALMNDLTHRV